MKTPRISRYLSIASLAALLPVGTAVSHAASPPENLTPDSLVGAYQSQFQAEPRPIAWDEGRRHKLRHAYWLLEQGDRDYHGHRAKAMEEIRKAGDILGMDLHGEGYGGEHQAWSDARLREAKGLLEELADKSGGREFDHLERAIKELDRALEVG